MLATGGSWHLAASPACPVPRVVEWMGPRAPLHSASNKRSADAWKWPVPSRLLHPSAMLPTLPIAPRDFCKPSTSTPAPRIRVAPALDLPSPQTPAIPAPLPIQARVRIRLTRLGRKKLPFYRIIAIDSRKRREGRPLQFLGWYNPFSKELVVNGEAVKLWLSCGAQPSDTARSLLVKAGVVEPFVRARDLPRSQPWPATLVGRGKPKKDGAGEGGEGAEEEAVEKAAAEGGKGVEDDEEHAADEAVQ